jgi:hypothetical protein
LSYGRRDDLKTGSADLLRRELQRPPSSCRPVHAKRVRELGEHSIAELLCKEPTIASENACDLVGDETLVPVRHVLERAIGKRQFADVFILLDVVGCAFDLQNVDPEWT